MTRSILLLSIAGSFACQEYEIKPADTITDVSDDGIPCIQITPPVVNFPNLDAAAGLQAQEIVIVTNCSTPEDGADLHIEDIYLEDESGPFSFSAISAVLIPPGSQSQFAVTFAPQTAGPERGYVYIESDDPNNAVAAVELNGTGIAPVIDISPSEYDFGTLYVGCDSSQPLTIANIGTADLIVESFAWATASNDLSFDALEAVNGPTPWTIPPNQSVEVYVDYAPLDELADAAFLTVTSNDPYLPEALVTQDGLGEIFGENSDVFEQPIQGSSDIIFAVDRSCSMYDDIATMNSNFGTFTQTLSNMNADFHVAAVVGDSGCVYGPDLYIDNSFNATQAESAIATMIDCYSQSNCNVNVPYAGNTERAFALLEGFLDEAVDMNGNPDPSGCNYGVVRKNAKLALVGVSDEPEQSPNNYSWYISLFQSLKSNPDDVVIHAIGGDYPSGCGSNSAYTGMYEASVATGGLFLSICATDWGTHLEALAEGSAQDLTSFELTEWPVPSTIEVFVNGIQTNLGWEYNATDNAIDFEEFYVPEGGDTIQIDYALYGDCNQ